jgi:multiple sugar transport system permease protein
MKVNKSKGATVMGYQSSAALSLSGRRKNRESFRHLCATKILPRIVLVVMCACFFLPFYQMLITSLKTTEELNAYPPTFWPRVFVWGNYAAAIQYIPFMRFTLNSVILAIGVTIGAVMSNSLIAYGFARIQWAGRDLIFFIAIITIFIPFPVTIVALFDIFAKIGWVNTYFPLIVPAFFGSGMYIFLMRQFLMELPKEISEAARIDGANEAQTFLQIILPLMKPSIAVVAIFAGVACWNDFLTPLLFLNTEELYPLSIGLQFFRSEHNVAYSLLMAASAMVVFPVIVLFLAFQRFFIEGVTVGSVKG